MRAPAGRPRVVDALLTGLLAVLAALDAWTPVLGTELPGPALVGWLVLATVAGLTWWRRSHPFEVTLAALALLLSWWVAVGVSIATSATLALAVLAYSVGRWSESRRRAAAALVALVAGMVAHLLLDPDARTWSAFRAELPWWLFLAGLWLVGAVRRYQALYAEGRERALRLEERAGLARELHDVLAHSLGVMVVQAEAAQELLRSGDRDDVDKCLTNIQDTGRQGLDDVRATLASLRDESAADWRPQPGLVDLDGLLERVRRAGLEVDVEVLGSPTDVPGPVSRAAYHVAQEALTNTLKHSGGDRARLRLEYTATELRVEVDDPGPRRHRAGPGTGRGLAGLRERLDAVRGHLDSGAERAGFRVAARMPLEVR